MRQPGGVLRLAAEALDELVVAPEPIVQDLDRDASSDILVAAEVDDRQTPGAELPRDQVAPVEERVDEWVDNGHSSRG